MLEKLWEKLIKEWKLIRGAPINFSAVCLIAAVLIGVGQFFVFKTIISIQSETIAAYQSKDSTSSSVSTPSLDAISALFAFENITNLVDGRKIPLGQTPMPHTIRITPPASGLKIGDVGYVEGKFIVITNYDKIRIITNCINRGILRVEYIAKFEAGK
jgi:hypothetical protein